jgi:hypothetical protein
MIAPALPTDQEIREEFQGMTPELFSRFRVQFRYLDPERKDDATAEGLAIAWHSYLTARRKGKHLTPSTIVFYTAKAVLAGRRLAGATNLDALSETTLARQRLGHTVSLSGVTDLSTGFYQVFGDRRWRWPVVEVVGAKVDFADFERQCSHRDRKLMELKAAGWRVIDIADRMGVSPPAVCQRLVKLRKAWDVMVTA